MMSSHFVEWRNGKQEDWSEAVGCLEKAEAE
jgi:hypothetical protein